MESLAYKSVIVNKFIQKIPNNSRYDAPSGALRAVSAAFCKAFARFIFTESRKK